MEKQRFAVATKEAYDVLMDELNKLGYKWALNRPCNTEGKWEEYESKTIIYVENSNRLLYGTYDNLNFHKGYGEPIDFKENNMLTAYNDRLEVVDLEPTKVPVELPNSVYEYLVNRGLNTDGGNTDNIIFGLVGRQCEGDLDVITHNMSKEDEKEFKKFMYQTDAIFKLSDASRYGFIKQTVDTPFKVGDMVVLKDGKNPYMSCFDNPQFPLKVTKVNSEKNQVQLFEKYEDLTQWVYFSDVEKIKRGTE